MNVCQPEMQQTRFDDGVNEAGPVGVRVVAEPREFVGYTFGLRRNVDYAAKSVADDDVVVRSPEATDVIRILERPLRQGALPCEEQGRCPRGPRSPSRDLGRQRSHVHPQMPAKETLQR
jgi:hypothetical protein